MPSLRAKLVNRFVRKTIKSLPLHDMEAEEIRRVFERKVISFLPRGITRESVTTPINGEWHKPENDETDNVILYFHGGGYVFGAPHTHRNLTYALARETSAALFSVDYRWLLDQGHDSSKISLAGDSAGGGLALATLQTIKAQHLPMPACAVLYSPYTDLSIEGISAKTNAEKDAMFQLDSIYIGAKYYAGELDVKDPRVSPLYGNMDGLPPLRIFASSSEILYDDSTRLAQRTKAAGVNVEFTSHDNLVHVWPVFYPLLPEAIETIRDSAKFILKHKTP